MSNLAKLDFMPLAVNGQNYLKWKLDAEIHLAANGLSKTIVEKNDATEEEKAKANIILRRHLHENTLNEYLTEKDPLALWNSLKQRYDHQKTLWLPAARFEWAHLRLQDFKTIDEYNSAMYRITSQLKLCGEPVTDDAMLEKTYSTFHPDNHILSQQYREKGYKKYHQLMDQLLLAEKNHELILKNHQTRPTGSAPFPEANAATHNDHQKDRGHASSRGRGNGRGRGRGGYRGGRSYRGGRGGRSGRDFKGPSRHQKWQNSGGNDKSGKAKGEDVCYRCGGTNHWSRNCRTPKHLVDLYQQSLKSQEKKIETNFAYGDDNDDFDKPGTSTHLELSDFCSNRDDA